MKDKSYFKELAKKLVDKMTIEECASQLMFESPKIERLNIEEYNYWCEALHGVAREGIATVFPQAIGMAASFDDDFLYKEATVISTEGRAKYNVAKANGDHGRYKGITFWSPNINIFRDPRWGRGHETYGEDPYLTSRMGVAFIKGMQQIDKSDYLKTAACAKHFCAHSGPEGIRHSFNAKVSKKDLFETYLPAFEACVKEAKVESVMGAYNAVNGIPACANDYTLHKILRDKWGFDGHVVSDCWALKDIYRSHKYVETRAEAASVSIKNGCDLNCGCVFDSLLDGLKLGYITEKEIRDACIRVYTTRFALGMMDGQETIYDSLGVNDINTDENRKLAKLAALKSTVLLKNDGILPLDRNKVKKIAVIGPNAHNPNAQIANYHGETDKMVTTLMGLQDYCKKYGIKVFYSKGCDIADKEDGSVDTSSYSEAISYAKEADVVIMCLGIDNTFEGEEGEALNNAKTQGDKANISIPNSQILFANKIFELNKPTIININTGSSIDCSMLEEKANGMICSWYSGEEGGSAFANIVFGDYSPCGKLPITFYHEYDNIPAFEDYSMKNRTYKFIDYKPWHEFGYGLSYSNYTYKLIEQSKTSRTIKIKVEITNNGDYSGDEVCEIYSSYNGSFDDKPNLSLIDFKRFFIKKGTSKTLQFNIPLSKFKLVNSRGNKVLPKGEYSIYIGGSSNKESAKIKLDFEL